jgi:rhodanese-related sulfurtransferase
MGREFAPGFFCGALPARNQKEKVVEFVQANIMWVGLAVISGGLLLWQLVTGNMGGASVSPMEATLLLNREEAIVIDVREPAEWSAGHIANARHIVLNQIATRLTEIEKFKTRPLIVCCASGNRSASACSTLRKAGFEKVFNLAGGINAWNEANLPVTTK